MQELVKRIEQNNATHQVTRVELEPLLVQAQDIFEKHHSRDVFFERSVFINWTCAIADCKYCYLSTKPKHDPTKELKALRSQASILAEVLICKQMGWKIGYLTGGLRVESADYLIDLLDKVAIVNKEKTMMNFGPYSHNIVKKFKPHITGMGSAIESFDEELHNFICPSKPLKALKNFLGYLQEEKLQKLITIILGMGEKKSDVDVVIENIKKYDINIIQLCFLKPQENTIFASVPSPDPLYMAWWIAKIRIACPEIKIKIALVRDRIEDTSLYLKAGANGFSRFMIFKDFASPLAEQLKEECEKAHRVLKGEFKNLPEMNLEEEVANLPFKDELKASILEKANQYKQKLSKLAER